MQQASVVTVTQPEFEPLTLAEATAQLRLEHSADDSLVNALITAVRQHAEGYLRRVIMPQVIRVGFDHFPSCGTIEIPRGNIRSVVSITYLDSDMAEQTVDAGDYYMDRDREPARIVPVRGTGWPAAVCAPGAVKVNLRAGFEPVGSPDDEVAQQAGVPRALKAGMLLHLGHLYENREAGVIGVMASEVPFAYDALVHPYRLLI